MSGIFDVKYDDNSDIDASINKLLDIGLTKDDIFMVAQKHSAYDIIIRLIENWNIYSCTESTYIKNIITYKYSKHMPIANP